MMSLFSTFDMNFSNLTIFLTILLISIYCQSIFSNTKIKIFSNKIKKELTSFFYSLKTKNLNKFTMLMMISMFSLILVANFTSIFPFIFPLTSQIGLVLFLSASIWSGLIMFFLIKNFKGMIAHLTPIGAPFILIPFLFMIEIISNLIRPITVSVRLTANILAGHLLMILLSKMVDVNFLFSVTYMMLNLVEMMVAFIQSYIFCTMLTLYYSEIS